MRRWGTGVCGLIAGYVILGSSVGVTAIAKLQINLLSNNGSICLLMPAQGLLVESAVRTHHSLVVGIRRVESTRDFFHQKSRKNFLLVGHSILSTQSAFRAQRNDPDHFWPYSTGTSYAHTGLGHCLLTVFKRDSHHAAR